MLHGIFYLLEHAGPPAAVPSGAAQGATQRARGEIFKLSLRLPLCLCYGFPLSGLVLLAGCRPGSARDPFT